MIKYADKNKLTLKILVALLDLASSKNNSSELKWQSELLR
jgi:hypothetical protein